MLVPIIDDAHLMPADCLRSLIEALRDQTRIVDLISAGRGR
jgi:hypothetical protein